MTWADELNLTKKQALVFLKKNKEIEKERDLYLDSRGLDGIARFEDNLKARAFREISSEARWVNKK